jgi:hypothetical protein
MLSVGPKADFAAQHAGTGLAEWQITECWCGIV